MMACLTKKLITTYGTKSRLLITNWLPFDLAMKFRISDKR